ncbi:ABC transporter%2C permease protein%2C SbmA/BacA family [Neisseria meningitidis]|nr:ABC transporter%2C permease protein%2C SbmA/BacA family [Neisseria meningitidis]
MNAGVVLIRAFNNVVNDFLDQGLAIKWSEQLNEVLTTRWLADKNYYRLQMRRHAPDNIDQRIQQDAQDFIASTIELDPAWSIRSLPLWNLPLFCGAWLAS